MRGYRVWRSPVAAAAAMLIKPPGRRGRRHDRGRDVRTLTTSRGWKERAAALGGNGRDAEQCRRAAGQRHVRTPGPGIVCGRQSVGVIPGSQVLART